MLEMLEEHMGLSGAEAEGFVDEMIDHMQGIDGDLDLGEMLDWCAQQAGGVEYGPGMMGEDGMMGGYGYDGYDMMDEDNSAYGAYGMMGETMRGYGAPYEGWHMMETAPTPENGPAQGGSDGPGAPTPSTAVPQENGSGYGSGPGGAMHNDSYGYGSTQEPSIQQAGGMMNEAGGMMNEALSPGTVAGNQNGATPTAPSSTVRPGEDVGFGPGSSGMMGGGMTGSGMMGR
jgi:hypothetical protein